MSEPTPEQRHEAAWFIIEGMTEKERKDLLLEILESFMSDVMDFPPVDDEFKMMVRVMKAIVPRLSDAEASARVQAAWCLNNMLPPGADMDVVLRTLAKTLHV